MPDVDDWVHRVGRCCRGHHGVGHALTFFEYRGPPSLDPARGYLVTSTRPLGRTGHGSAGSQASCAPQA